MRGAALWVAGAALAFIVTAGAFLVLANLATDSPAEELTPAPAQGKPGPAVDLDLDTNRLASLRPREDQELLITVENTGDKNLDDVNLTLNSFSGDTSDPRSRYYRRTVQDLKAGEDTEVRFVMDLSGGGASASPAPLQEPSRILEVRATTPEGVTAVRTVILPV